jgi:hypothetical protein
MLKYLTSSDGASSAEYAMLLGILGGLVAIALFVFGGAVAEQMDSATTTVASGGAPTASSGTSGAGGASAGASGRGGAAAALAGGNGQANASGSSGLGTGGRGQSGQ